MTKLLVIIYNVSILTKSWRLEIENKRYIGHEIKALSNLIKRRVDEGALQSDVSGLTGMQVWIIGYLSRQENERDIFQKDIEAEFNISRSTATGILKLMEKNGLITREAVSYDARLKMLLLTPKAKKICEITKRAITRIENKMESGLTQEELSTFFTIIDKITNNVE